MCWVQGLDQAFIGEVLTWNSDRFLVMQLEPEHTICAALDHADVARPGHRLQASGQFLAVPCGKELLGTELSPGGLNINGELPVHGERRTLDNAGPGICEGAYRRNPSRTGVLAIDTLCPIARGGSSPARPR